MAISELKQVWLDSVVHSYAHDEFVQQKLQKLSLDASADESFSLVIGCFVKKSYLDWF